MSQRPGGPEIRLHRLSRPLSGRPRRRIPMTMALAAVVLVPTVGGSSAAGAQDPAEAPPAPEIAPPEPTTATAGPGTYSAPMWLPLRRNVDGAEIKVGCTYRSFGSDHGYACSGHHDRWAIDFIADAGTPVFAAGAGFATNLTGQPGGSGFGNVVRIDHGFGRSTVYAHLTEAMVPPEGSWVDETTQIGTVGSTGSASTAHLHYERFTVPTLDTDIGDQTSVDPGPLFACRGDLLVSFPQVAGFTTWQGLSWGSLTVASDGHDCATTAPAATTEDRDLPTRRGGGWFAALERLLAS